MTALACTILAIDPGKTSGWAILQPALEGGAPYLRSGTAKGIQDLRLAVAGAQIVAVEEVPLVIVGETWKGMGGPGRRMSPQTLAGIGASWGRWAAIIELAKHPHRRIVRLDTGTWRQRLYGKSRLKSETAKKMAQNYTRAAFGVDVGPDEAEAICIGVVAQRAPEVVAVLPKRRTP